MSNLMQRINENTISIKELATALKDSSDRTIELQVDAILDDEKIGEGRKQAVINVLDDAQEKMAVIGD